MGDYYNWAWPNLIYLGTSKINYITGCLSWSIHATCFRCAHRPILLYLQSLFVMQSTSNSARHYPYIPVASDLDGEKTSFRLCLRFYYLPHAWNYQEMKIINTLFPLPNEIILDEKQ